jgi:hypothetical protein
MRERGKAHQPACGNGVFQRKKIVVPDKRRGIRCAIMPSPDGFQFIGGMAIDTGKRFGDRLCGQAGPEFAIDGSGMTLMPGLDLLQAGQQDLWIRTLRRQPELQLGRDRITAAATNQKTDDQNE